MVHIEQGVTPTACDYSTRARGPEACVDAQPCRASGAFRLHPEYDPVDSRALRRGLRGALDGELPLSEVAATSLALTELVTSLLAANRSFGADAAMPTVQVAAGSVDFLATGPGLVVGGLSLLATCGVGVISAPVMAGTAVLMGAIDLTLNWQKRSSEKGRSDAERAKADAERARADAKKIEAETIGQELENEIKRVRLANLPAQGEAHRSEKPETPPASFIVPFALIERSSQENGLAAAHGVHLINRGLPSLFGILRVMPGLLITVENKAT